ncbi:alpha/beta fold hydrolase [Oleomonas cavernae]|uniref:Alpha/beta fold hydrolase n=1 Tax=Oleomonas cavernae TaxID=2320859 RepID=A0A418WBK0_9PROT|nr:alpha/beta fold hydrolase [Oleomonas cavernae]RJF87379.1 alpha/beta fold hydrolase [Oleomonas cavernae]
MFTFDLSPSDLFEERSKQFVAWGIPEKTIRNVQARVVDTWADGPGGWTYEWMQEATRAKAAADWLLASSLFGAARFPCLAKPNRVAALDEQVKCFLKASSRFPGQFERRLIQCNVHGEIVGVPVHIYMPKGTSALPTVLLSGGVDTGKMELHRIALMLSKLGGLRVVAMDMPGTGESNLPLTDEVDSVYRTVLDTFRGQGKIGILGVSFGGHWAAKLALRRDVDVAVNFGGPIGANDIDGAYIAGLPNGMPGIIGNAMRLKAYPDAAVADRMLQGFSLRDQGLLDQADCARMLVVNGSADPYIPLADVEVFRRYPSAEVWLLRGLGHCAAEKIARVVPGMITWLRKELHGESVGNRLFHGVALMLRPETC